MAAAVDATQIDLSAIAPASDGGAAITGYQWQVSEDGTTFVDLVGATALTYSHTGLSDGDTRHYRIAAITSVGRGAYNDPAVSATTGGTMSNFQRIAAFAGSFAIRFTASSVVRDYYEFDPAEGHTSGDDPAGMFTDDTILWIERVRGITTVENFDDLNNVYSMLRLNFNRGGSTVDFDTFVGALGDEWSWVMINETSDEYIMWQANSPQISGITEVHTK